MRAVNPSEAASDDPTASDHRRPELSFPASLSRHAPALSARAAEGKAEPEA